jgi:hypothetical protein
VSAPVLQRDRELSALARCLDDVAAGRGGRTVISGPLGIGKTTLLGWPPRGPASADSPSSPRAGRPWRARTRTRWPRRLFEPLGLDRDAAPADLMTGAATLATRAFRPDAGLAGDPFATVHGLYWLTVNLSGRAPVLLAVDDCHWADEPSLRFLAYLAARLDGLPVGPARHHPDRRAGDRAGPAGRAHARWRRGPPDRAGAGRRRDPRPHHRR